MKNKKKKSLDILPPLFLFLDPSPLTFAKYRLGLGRFHRFAELKEALSTFLRHRLRLRTRVHQKFGSVQRAARHIFVPQ